MRQLINSNFWQIANVDVNGNITQVVLDQPANLSVGGGSNNQVLTTDGAGNLRWQTAAGNGSATAAGNTYEVQYNAGGGVFGADANFFYNPTTQVMFAPQGEFSNIGAEDIETDSLLVFNSANLGAVGNVVITGGVAGQFLRTDGQGNLSWAPGSGTVTEVTGTGSGLGFSLSGDVTSNGALTLTVPGSVALRNTLNIGTAANVNLNSNANTFLNGEGNWVVSPAVANIPNIVIDGNVANTSNGNWYFKDSTQQFNRIDWQIVNGNIEAVLDQSQPVFTGNSITGTSVRVIDNSFAYTTQFMHTGGIAANIIYDLPNAPPSTANLVLTATVPDGNGITHLSWAEGGGNGSAGNLVPYIKFEVTSNGNAQTFANVELADYGNANDMAVFYNGGLVTEGDYSLNGSNLTMNVYMNTGDLVEVIRQGAGGNGGGGGGAGTNWDTPANIAVGDIFAGFVADYVNPGSIYNASGDINTNLQFWQVVPAPASAYWASVTYGAGTFVAVEGFLSLAATSTDGGVSWTQHSLPATATWNSVTYGNGVFVAVASGSGGSNIAATSPDGITWTQQTLPASASWNSVTYGNGVFVAVASNTNIAATSPDGVTWTQRSLPVSANWSSDSVTYGNGTFVAVAQNSSIAATSTDNGVTWTQQTLPASVQWRSVAYGNGTFVAVAYNTNIAATSPDGITWTQRSLPVSANWQSVAYGGGVFVAVTIGFTTIAATSPDGINWTSITLPVSADWNDVTYGGNTWIAISQGSTFASPAEFNLIYIEHTEQTAPVGTYRCLGGVDPLYPIYLWTRVT